MIPKQALLTLASLALFVTLSFAQDFSCMDGKDLFTAKFEACDGNNVIIYKIVMSAPFNRVEKRHVLYTGQKATFCVAGQVNDSSISMEHLQNAVWGGVGGADASKVDFCDIHINACKDIQPPCESGSGTQLTVGTDFCMCSDLDVPANAPGFGINVYWKMLSVGSTPTDCEKEFDNDILLANGKTPVMCVQSPAVLRKEPPSQS